MDQQSSRWNTISESPHQHEREALAFIRERLPDHDPYSAWANFEFIVEGGQIHEVDFLVMTPKGGFMVAIKNWEGGARGP